LLHFFLSHPIQYVSPLLKELAVTSKLKVYYYGGNDIVNEDIGFGQKISWDIPLLDGYSYEFLKNLSPSKGMNNHFFDAINLSIIRVIRKKDDAVVVINGWAYLSDWFVIFSALIYRKRVWLRSEMPWNQELLKPHSFRRKLKFLFFRYIFFKFFINKFLYIGSQNKEYYLMHGVKEADLIYTPYAVDNERFQSYRTDVFHVRPKWSIKKEQFVILYSGKLIEKKRPFDLLMAFERLNNENCTLFFMGDGPLRNSMEEYIAKNDVNNVIISGFINQLEISSIYSMSDLFVMCSGIGETWGLAINEAMNFSLPVLVSSTCGSSFDLVENGKNGYIFKEGDVESLSYYLEELISDKFLCTSMGEYSRIKIQEFSHGVSCRNIVLNINNLCL
jgi:glycosyltransferase involved in cell wall biosynthesis